MVFFLAIKLAVFKCCYLLLEKVQENIYAYAYSVGI